jgi:hypothetical protein
MVVAIERLMARRQVHAEILTDPAMITPVRKVKIDTADGGWRWSPPTPQVPVQVLIIPAKRRLSDMIVATELGNVVDYPYIILARHFADIKRDDTFTWQGEEFQVKTISIKTEVSITAQVDYFGGAKNG